MSAVSGVSEHPADVNHRAKYSNHRHILKLSRINISIDDKPACDSDQK